MPATWLRKLAESSRSDGIRRAERAIDRLLLERVAKRVGRSPTPVKLD